MKETVKICTDKALMSEVELNKELIRVGDKLYYSDATNFETWAVTELFEGGFEAKDDEETKDFYFDELQKGWDISEKTKENHKLYDRFEYKN